MFEQNLIIGLLVLLAFSLLVSQCQLGDARTELSTAYQSCEGIKKPSSKTVRTRETKETSY